MTQTSLQTRVGCHWLGQCRVAALLAIWAIFLAGCPSAKQPAQPAAQAGSPDAPRASVALRVLIVNEPALVEALNRLRGEWAERSAGELTALGTTWKDLNAAKSLDADVLIFPSRYLGELCVRDWLRPVRGTVLEDDDFKSADILPLVRNELIKWGGQTMALPLGIDPTTIIPAPSESPAITLLSLAAPHAITNERIGVLFDTETMKPRITELPFVEALLQLVQNNSEHKDDSKSALPTGDRQLPILGFGDRLIAVTSSSHNAASAFKLIEWLAQPDTSSQFARLDGGVLPVRISLAASPEWYDSATTTNDRSRLGKSLIAALSGQQCLLIPRIPGIDDYLAALSAAVKTAEAEKVPPQQALQAAAEKWEQITNARDRKAQRQAYLRHLGIEP